MRHEARPGDEFESLVETYRNELRAHCYRMLGSLADADDALQDTLVRAWRGIQDYEERGSIRAWLYRIATNRCLTLIEQRGRRELPVDTLSSDVPVGENAWLGPFPDLAANVAPDARFEALETIELAFIALLQRLSAVQRAVLMLRDVVGWSAAETAAALGLTVAAANSSLQRARGVLRQELPSPSQQIVLRDLGGENVRRLAARYATAWEAGDVDAIVALLTGDATYSMPPEHVWYSGHEAIRRFLLEGPLSERWRLTPIGANGQLAFGTYSWDKAAGLFVAVSIDVVAIRGDLVNEVVSFLETSDFTPFGLPNSLGN